MRKTHQSLSISRRSVYSSGSKRSVTAVCLLLAILFSAFSFAQNETGPSDDPQLRAQEISQSIPLQQIDQLSSEIHSLRSKLEQKGTSKPDKEERIRIEQRLRELGDTLEEIATGTADLGLFKQDSGNELSWREQLQDISKPFLLRLKSLTERPREIEELKREREALQTKAEAADLAHRNIQRLLDEKLSKQTTKQLQQLQADWKEQLASIESQLDIVNFQLQEKLDAGQNQGLVISLAIQEFLTGRGLNLILALFSLLASFAILRYLGARLELWLSRGQDREGRVLARATHIAFQLIAVTLSIFTLLLVLYMRNDWLLLTLVVLFLAALVFTLRNSLPNYISEARLLLNLGPVREGERVLYEGIPFKVSRLNIYSDLVNPRLSGGRLRLPLSTMMQLRSRRWSKDEPWFPTKPGDVVILNDGTFGTVLLQTPEIVTLELFGIETQTLEVSQFLASAPRNLSSGFALFIDFGLDYGLQEWITREIPEQLESYIHAELEKTEFAAHLRSLNVEFSAAGASALEVKILGFFEGDIAEHYYGVQRALQKAAVNACNHFGWTIPFNQLTVHMANQTTGEAQKEEGRPTPAISGNMNE